MPDPVADQGRAAVAVCPLCSWRSAEVPLRDEPNAEWHARAEAATQYRGHFDRHRPLAYFIVSGDDLSAVPDTQPNAQVGPEPSIRHEETP
jgi:hypothetical protein